MNYTRTVYMLALTCAEYGMSSQKQPRLHSQISTKTKDSPLDYHQTLPVPLAVLTFGVGEEGPDVILKLTLKVISIMYIDYLTGPRTIFVFPLNNRDVGRNVGILPLSSGYP